MILTGDNGHELYHWDFTPDVDGAESGAERAVPHAPLKPARWRASPDAGIRGRQGVSAPRVLFSEDEIRVAVALMAGDLARLSDPPEIVSPILVGAFVFAADLLRALSRKGSTCRSNISGCRSYGASREGGEMRVLAGPGDAVAGKHVLLIDGVLDHGHTLITARDLLTKAGARKITTAIVVDKAHETAPIRADHACFTGVTDFIVGYGMDDAGHARGLPYIGVVE